MADIILNFFIFAVTAVLVAGTFRKDGKWTPERGRSALRFYTCQSNILCAAAALATGIAGLCGELPEWVWILKYVGTAAVTVTMLTVFLFLAPSVGKDWYGVLLKGSGNLFMHLVTPVIAIVTFCVFERRGMSFPQCLWGLLPVVLYGSFYLYKTIFAPEEKRWEDFYGFNKKGRWMLSFSTELAGTFLICLAFMAVQNL